MIKTEELTIRGRQFVRTYSDAGMLIHGGMPEGDYEDAIDPAELGRTYTETNIPVDSTDAEEIVSILTGESK
jgi:hypothetical protein